MKIPRNANAVVGLALLAVGAVALVAGMDTPATGASSRIVIRSHDGDVHHYEFDDADLEQFGEDMAEWSEQFGDQIAAMLENLDIDIDIDGHGPIHVIRDERFEFDADRFAEHMERMAASLSGRLENLDRHDARRIEDQAERMAAQVQRRVERAMRQMERTHDRAWDRAEWRRDRERAREARREYEAGDATSIRREIRELERRLERLQRELESIDDDGR